MQSPNLCSYIAAFNTTYHENFFGSQGKTYWVWLSNKYYTVLFCYCEAQLSILMTWIYYHYLCFIRVDGEKDFKHFHLIHKTFHVDSLPLFWMFSSNDITVLLFTSCWFFVKFCRTRILSRKWIWNEAGEYSNCCEGKCYSE